MNIKIFPAILSCLLLHGAFAKPASNNALVAIPSHSTAATKPPPALGPKKYNEQWPQLCYINEQGQTQCTVISAAASKHMRAKDLTLQSKDLLTKITQNLAKIITPQATDPRYPGAKVYDLSYNNLRAQINPAYLSAAQNTLLQQQLALFDQISAKFAASPTGKITYTPDELTALHAVFLGPDRAMHITGTTEDSTRLQQIFDQMLANRIGFERAATLAITKIMRPSASPITIARTIDTGSGSNADYMGIDFADEAELDLSLFLCHELSHIYHQQIIGYNHLLPGSMELLMASALTDNTIAYIYNYFPALRDLEQATSQYIPTDGERNNINDSIKKINAAGLGKLINDMQKANSQLSNADIAKIVFIEKYCLNDTGENIWTDPEELLTIKGELTFRNNNQRIVIIDAQNEHEFANIAGIHQRIGHSPYAKHLSQQYDNERELVSALEQHHGSVVHNTICQHLALEFNDAKITQLIQSLQADKLPDLKCVDLSGATVNGKLTLKTMIELLQITIARNIKVILPQQLDAGLREACRQEIIRAGQARFDHATTATIDELVTQKISLAELEPKLQNEPPLVKLAINQTMQSRLVELVKQLQIQAEKSGNKQLETDQKIDPKIQTTLLQQLNPWLREAIKQAKQVIITTKNTELAQAALQQIQQQFDQKIATVLADMRAQVAALNETDFIEFIMPAIKAKLAQQIQLELIAAKKAANTIIDRGYFDNGYGSYIPFTLCYLEQFTAAELSNITRMEFEASMIDADIAAANSLMANNKLINLKHITLSKNQNALVSIIALNLAQGRLPKLEVLSVHNIDDMPPEIIYNLVAATEAKNVFLNTNNQAIIKQQLDFYINQNILTYDKLIQLPAKDLSRMVTSDDLSKITFFDFQYIQDSDIDKPEHRIMMRWFEDGKLHNLTTIDLCNTDLNHKFIAQLAKIITANKLPALEKIALDTTTKISTASRNLLNHALEQLQVRRSTLSGNW